MKKLFLLLILSFFSTQGYAASCPDGSEPVKSISADGTYFVYNCGGQASSSNVNSNIKASFELNPIRHMVEPKNIKLSGSMDSLQLRGRFDDIKFWDNETKKYVVDENFYTSFYDVIIDFKKENY